LALRWSKSGGKKTGASGISACAKKSATQSAATLPRRASRPCGSRLCTMQVMAPTHQTSTAATIAIAVGLPVKRALCAASSGRQSRIAAAALSAAIERTNMAESAVARPAGRGGIEPIGIEGVS
jgi:hypothetical protein